MKWRSMAADYKEKTVRVIDEPTGRNDLDAVDVVIGTNELDDDLAVLKDLLRNTFGVDDKLTFIQQKNRKKT